MSDEQPTREEIYDDQISLLISQIIAICKEHKIPLVANFLQLRRDMDEWLVNKLKAPPPVQYRPATLLDRGRTDAEFRDRDDSDWGNPRELVGYSSGNGHWHCEDFSWKQCRVPVLPTDPAPGYREPVLPADCGRPCEFSDDRIEWKPGYIRGFSKDSIADELLWRVGLVGGARWNAHFCRIKTEQST